MEKPVISLKIRRVTGQSYQSVETSLQLESLAPRNNIFSSADRRDSLFDVFVDNNFYVVLIRSDREKSTPSDVYRRSLGQS